MVIITEETNLSNADITALADLYSEAFEHDPISIRCIGVERGEDRNLWKAVFLDNVLQAVQSGRIILVRSEDGEILAGAACYGPGQEMPSEPATQELKDLVSNMSAEQQAFRAKYSELQEAIHREKLPANYVRDNLFVFQFAVAPAHQRQGLGSQLIQYIIKQTGFKHNVVLDTSKQENVLFYEANGFELKGYFEIEHYKFGPLPRMYTLAREVMRAL